MAQCKKTSECAAVWKHRERAESGESESRGGQGRRRVFWFRTSPAGACWTETCLDCPLSGRKGGVGEGFVHTMRGRAERKRESEREKESDKEREQREGGTA